MRAAPGNAARRPNPGSYAEQSLIVMPVGPDSVDPPGPEAIARTVPEPESGPNAAPLSVADQRLPEPLA